MIYIKTKNCREKSACGTANYKQLRKEKRESLHIIRVGGGGLKPFFQPSSSFQFHLIQIIYSAQCHSQVPPNSNYCNICGTPLRQPLLLRICSSCKTKIPVTANFCPDCGQEQRKNKCNGIYP